MGSLRSPPPPHDRRSCTHAVSTRQTGQWDTWAAQAPQTSLWPQADATWGRGEAMQTMPASEPGKGGAVPGGAGGGGGGVGPFQIVGGGVPQKERLSEDRGGKSGQVRALFFLKNDARGEPLLLYFCGWRSY